MTVSAWIIGTDNGVYRWNGTRLGSRLGLRCRRSAPIDPARRGSSTARTRSTSGTEIVSSPGPERPCDIGAGSDVWIIGTDDQIYRRGPNEWTPVGGSGVRISAGADGTAWVVNQRGEIFRWESDGFRRVNGTAMDIAANATGETWMIGTRGGGRGFRRAAPR